LKLAIIAGLLILAANAHAQINLEKMADAIYKAEGGANTKYPYGIRSIACKDAGEARRVCIHSISNSIIRWEKAGKSKPFIEFMADRYCPPQPDHDRWVRNVTKLMQ